MNKILLSIFTFLAATNIASFAQIDYDFEGYFQDLPVVQFIPGELSNLYGVRNTLELNLSRVRLKPVVYLWENARLNIEAESDLLLYKNLTGFFNLNDEKTNRQTVKLKWESKGKNYSFLNFIDRLYLRQGFGWGNVTIGRQRISWGTGRIWNPTDLFNPINPTTFYKIEKDGADAISTKIFLGNFTDLNLVFNPQTQLSESNFGFRFRTNILQYDFSIMSGRFDGRNVVGGDFAGNLSEAGIRGEGIYYAPGQNNEKAFFKYILGIDYQFTSKFYALAEYHYNGEGKLKKAEYQLQRLMKGEILNLSKSYLAVSAMYNATPLLNLTFTNINNLVDGSSLFGFRGDYSLTENSYLDFGAQYFFGEKYSEYWYYPSSLYLLFEYYF
jgi:hypothetical protein